MSEPIRERNDSAHRQDAVRGRVDIKDEEHHCQRDQHKPGNVDRQDRGQIEREDQGNRANHAGQDRAGRGHFTDNSVDGDEHENKHDLGPPELLEDALGWGHFDLRDLCRRRYSAPCHRRRVRSIALASPGISVGD